MSIILVNRDGRVITWGPDKFLFGTEINFGVAKVAQNDEGAVFVTDEGEVWVSGQNNISKFGIMNGAFEHEPKKVPMFSIGKPCELRSQLVDSVFTGYDSFVFATTDQRTFVCGQNSYGKLGIGNQEEFTFGPIELLNLSIISASCGREHTAFITTGNKLLVCGRNACGELGLGKAANFRHTPTEVPNMLAKSVACSDVSTLVLGIDGKVYGCGYNCRYKLGWTKNHTYKLTEIELSESRASSGVSSSSKAIFLTRYYTLIITKEDDVWVCGGNNYGQLGLGHTKNVTTFTKVPDIKAVSGYCCRYNIFLMTENNEVLISGLGHSSSEFTKIPDIHYDPPGNRFSKTKRTRAETAARTVASIFCL